VLGTGGVDLPRTASDQFYNGKSIDKAHLAPGDLVFFKNTYRHGISHVGIYTGNGNFIHACNPSRGVVESSLNEPYYANHWAGGRRVLSAIAQRLPTTGRW
jgi:cell wall-associated NlpC family hydrolase